MPATADDEVGIEGRCYAALMLRPWTLILPIIVACSDDSGDAEPSTSDTTGSDATHGTSLSTVSPSVTSDATTGTSLSTVSLSVTDAMDSTADTYSTTTTGNADQCNVAQFCIDATEDGACRHELDVGDGMSLYYWANLPLGDDSEHADCRARVDRIVLVSHGNSRNPWSYFDSIQDAAVTAGVEHDTLIVAPYFMAPEDEPAVGFHAWDPGGTGWKSGDDSITAPPTSSFAIVDQLIVQHALETGQYPAVTEVVLTGHSAGGQLMQRHAISTALEDAPAMDEIHMRHIVANPSSFAYLDGFRWNGQGTVPQIDLEIPSGTGCDNSYDDYKYGLTDVPSGHYVEAALRMLPDRFLARDVTYLLGEEDTMMDSGLDTSCAANLQGSQRFERGMVFAAYLDVRYPTQSHMVVTVPGVGHSKSAMYESAEGVATLFP